MYDSVLFYINFLKIIKIYECDTWFVVELSSHPMPLLEPLAQYFENDKYLYIKM